MVKPNNWISVFCVASDGPTTISYFRITSRSGRVQSFVVVFQLLRYIFFNYTQGSTVCSYSVCFQVINILVHQRNPIAVLTNYTDNIFFIFQDPDIIHAWLADLQMEEYARLFIEAGYDLPTVTRMTPEDLTAVGIKKPNHRKRLKAELANLNVPDNLPDYIPVSIQRYTQSSSSSSSQPICITLPKAGLSEWESLGCSCHASPV